MPAEGKPNLDPRGSILVSQQKVEEGLSRLDLLLDVFAKKRRYRGLKSVNLVTKALNLPANSP